MQHMAVAKEEDSHFFNNHVHLFANYAISHDVPQILMEGCHLALRTVVHTSYTTDLICRCYLLMNKMPFFFFLVDNYFSL